MAQQYFIDTESFLTASGIWLDQDLQTKAPNGFYAFGGIYRRMANGELLRHQQCPSCEPDPEPCGEGLSFGGGVSYPTTNIVNLGEGTGDVELTYEAFSIPDRFIVIWDGSVVIDTGYVGNPALFDFGGTQRSGFNDSLTGKEDPVTETIYPDFTNFPDDGYPRVSSPAAGTVSFSKASPTPTTAQLDIYGPQSGTAWNATLGCPETPSPPPPPTIYEFFLSGGESENDGHCGDNYIASADVFTSDGDGTIDQLLGARLYTDTGLTTPLNGNNLYYFVSDTDNDETANYPTSFFVIFVDEDGFVLNVIAQDCNGNGGGPPI